MRRSLLLSLFALSALVAALCQPATAAIGTPDPAPGATLVVPYFETGIDRSTHPHDSILVVHNVFGFSATVHYVVWTIDGDPLLGLSGNVTLGPAEAFSRAMRDHLDDNASEDDLEALADGDFYRGFVTFDVVSGNTSLTPFSPNYPFAPFDALEGFIYYTRLGEGSSNGLAMTALQWAGLDADPALTGFYASNEGIGQRERIDASALLCSDLMTRNPDTTECSDPFDGIVERVHGRAFLSEPLVGSTRFVVFAWDTMRFSDGGPSAICDANPVLECESEYELRRYVENGDLVETRTVRLDHVVNVIEFDDGAIGGLLSLLDVPDPDFALQVIPFTFNSAKPPGKNQNWDAIFPGVVVP